MVSLFLTDLKLRGYSINSNQNYNEFLDHISRLGHSYHECEIKPTPGKKALLASDKAMPLHNDDPRAQYISWYCKQSAEEGGESVLVDFNEVKSNLDPSVLACLETVLIKVPLDQKSESFTPMLSSSGVYYADWLVDRILNQQQRDALMCFNIALETAPKTHIKLAMGESLTIDNKRMLHARTAFKGQRILIRHWIQSIR